MEQRNLRNTWDQIYLSSSHTLLPWQGLRLPEFVKERVFNSNQQASMLLTGCGTGEVISQIHNLPNLEIVGADISKVAIHFARVRFPNIEFFASSTEDLAESGDLKFDIVLDWLVLHHIQPSELEGYCKSLRRLANRVLLGWLYTPTRSTFVSAVKPDDVVYNHEEASIKRLFPNMGEKVSKKFSLEPNPYKGSQVVLEGQFLELE